MIKLFKILLSLIVAPFRWVVACIKRDRFRVYPGKVVQIIGLPGTGKTMAAHALMVRSAKMFDAKYATEDAGSKIAQKITLHDIGTHRFRRCLFLIDESSLNGLDAREWSGNFKGDRKNILRQLKLVRHYHNAFITTSQSAGDNDSKVRGLSSSTWVAHSFFHAWIIVKRAVQWFEWQDGQYLPHLDEPSVFEMICDPYSHIILRKKRWGKLYNSWATVSELDVLPYFRSEDKKSS